MLVGLVVLKQVKLLLGVVPFEELGVALREAHEDEVVERLHAHDVAQHREVLVDLQLLVMESPDRERQLGAEREEHVVLRQLDDLLDLLAVNGEACVDLLEPLDVDEDDGSLGEALAGEARALRAA